MKLILDVRDSTGILWVCCIQNQKCVCNLIVCSCALFLYKFKIEFRRINVCLILGISEFIAQSIQTVSKFESVVKHIQKYEQDIDSILHSFVTAKLLKFPDKPDKLDDLPGM